MRVDNRALFDAARGGRAHVVALRLLTARGRFVEVIDEPGRRTAARASRHTNALELARLLMTRRYDSEHMHVGARLDRAS